MRTTPASVADQSIALKAEFLCEAEDDVAEVRPLEGYSLFVRFHDGTAGRVHMARMISAQSAGVFAQLADPVLFRDVAVVLGAVTWVTGQDLAPDAMYEAFRSNGEWVLS